VKHWQANWPIYVFMFVVIIGTVALTVYNSAHPAQGGCR
jgi:hypothetical protein